MDILEYKQMVADPTARRDNHKVMLPIFYSFATSAYRANWAESFHLPPFHGNSTLAQALIAQEHGLADKAGFRAGMRLLDIGCGIGGPALSIVTHCGAHVTGINIVPRHIEIAQGKARDSGLVHLLDFLTADMMFLPFPACSFDGAYSFDAICHAPDKARAYAEIARVLKPGAAFAGCDWLYADGLSEAEYQEWIEPVCASSALPAVLSLGQVAGALATAGFIVQDCHNLAEDGDMTPNWELFERAAATIPPPRSPAKEVLYQHTLSTSRAGRAGMFVIGTWLACKPPDGGATRHCDVGAEDLGRSRDS